jgi:hypothetical protein
MTIPNITPITPKPNITPHPAWEQVLGQENVQTALTFLNIMLTRTLDLNYADHTEDEKSTYGQIGITLSDQNRLPKILNLFDLINRNPNFEDDPMEEFVIIGDIATPDTHDKPETNTPFPKQAKALAAYILRDIAEQLNYVADEITNTGQGVIVTEL